MHPYSLKRSKRSRGISVRIVGTGKILVTAPPLVPKMLVELFLKQQTTWIDSQLKKTQEKQVVENKDSILIFGKLYRKKIISDTSKNIGFVIADQELIYNYPLKLVTATSSTYKQAVSRFLRQTAEQYLLPKSHQLAKKMNTKFMRINLREQHSRWGSCSSRGSINFNWRLVHFAPQLINYVIIHELAHLTHHNHSRKFWALVAKFAPSYKKLQRNLRQFSIPVI